MIFIDEEMMPELRNKCLYYAYIKLKPTVVFLSDGVSASFSFSLIDLEVHSRKEFGTELHLFLFSYSTDTVTQYTVLTVYTSHSTFHTEVLTFTTVRSPVTPFMKHATQYPVYQEKQKDRRTLSLCPPINPILRPHPS